VSGPQNTPKTALVLAAGLGTRMRPLTNDRPKALVEVAGRAMIDHVLDRLGAGGVETAVVNVHAFADRLEAHLAARTVPRIIVSDERGRLLETGGGLKKARPLLGEAPIFVANTDSVWLENGRPAVETLTAAWDPERMDACLLLARLEAGRLTFRGEEATAPYAYMGLHIAKPQIVAEVAQDAFSLAPIWRRLADEGRLCGAVLDGFWMHVGDPVAREAAEARLR